MTSYHDTPTIEAFPPTMMEPKGARRISATWKLGTDDFGKDLVVKLTCGHSPDNKAFYATARTMKQWQDGAFHCSSFDVFGGPQVKMLSVRTPRYSKKGLQEFFDATLEDLRLMETRGHADALALLNVSVEGAA